MNTPTKEMYDNLQSAYAYFNKELFETSLPNCLITLQRHAGSLGYFRCRPFVSRNGERTDEISLNPKFFLSRTDRGVLSTLVHEMAHLQQYHLGRPGRAGYHNRQWADRMITLGLYPSHTGEPGGSETGYSMTHYIVELGRFDVACGALLSQGFQFSWVEEPAEFRDLAPITAGAVAGVQDSSNRWKYTCPSCGNNAWGKPAMDLICGSCLEIMPTILRSQSRDALNSKL
jgi:predicted SprT family Zn-dependent metalloprotease